MESVSATGSEGLPLTPEAFDQLISDLSRRAEGLTKASQSVTDSLAACVPCGSGTPPGGSKAKRAASKRRMSVGEVRGANQVLEKVGDIRDWIERVLVEGTGGDRVAVRQIFGDEDGCKRIARLRVLLQVSTEQLQGTQYQYDVRFQQCVERSQAVEGVLKTLGLRELFERALDEAWQARNKTAVPQSGGDQEIEPSTFQLQQVVEVPGTPNSSSKPVLIPSISIDQSEVKPLDLVFRIKKATNLAAAEWRFPFALVDHARVYLELTFGAHRQLTEEAKKLEATGSVEWENLAVKYPFSGVRSLEFTLRDRRKYQSVLRGDPIIGEGLVTGFSLLATNVDRTFVMPVKLQTRYGRPCGELLIEAVAVPAELGQVNETAS